MSSESIGDAEGGLICGLMDVGALATAGAIVASGGAIATMVAGAVIAGGTGGLIGPALATLVDIRHARHLREHLEHGGLLLWVNIRDAEHGKRATEILSRHSGRDVHVHDLPAVEWPPICRKAIATPHRDGRYAQDGASAVLAAPLYVDRSPNSRCSRPLNSDMVSPGRAELSMPVV